MSRNRGTDRNGGPFSEATKQSVWQKAQITTDYASSVRRLDTCGAPIDWAQYGNTNSKAGWEIDHIKPVSKDGGDELSNLQPLQWENNRHKADEYPNWSCYKKN